MKPIPKERWPMLLTYGRIAAIPLFLAVFYLPGAVGAWLSCGVFVAASVTDWLDGHLARKYHAVSETGRFLDPIADKLLVAVALLLLLQAHVASAVPVIMIICRELWVSGLREFMGQRSVVIPVSTLAKWKTAAQMTAVSLLLLSGADYTKLELIGTLLLWIAAGISAISAYRYTQAAWGVFELKN